MHLRCSGITLDSCWNRLYFLVLKLQSDSLYCKTSKEQIEQQHQSNNTLGKQTVWLYSAVTRLLTVSEPENDLIYSTLLFSVETLESILQRVERKVLTVRTELLRPDTMQDTISAYMCVACLEKRWLPYLGRGFEIYLWPAYQGF